jgi:beta-N-acetylhexosaminidase
VLAALGLTGWLTASQGQSGGSGGPAKPPPSSAGPKANPRASSAKAIPLPGSPSKLLGQRIMVGFSGTSPSAALLSSVRRGDVGSVILFASNLQSRSQTVALTSALQRAARAGGNPKLLISTDQEGGQVKRLPAGPPDRSPPQMVATGNVATASGEGRATGLALRRWGINVDLAPVADVPTSPAAFIWRQSRAFSFNAGTVAKYATAFAAGLQARGVAATGKHFPGLGSAINNTDFRRDELHPTAAQRTAALAPYESMIPRGLDIVMLSVAGYPAYDPSGASAALSRPIIARLLRGQLKFGGVTMTDALGSTTGHDELTAGVLAASAGADILLFTDSAPGELRRLRTALAGGQITRAQAAASYRRIVTLKRRLGLD